MKKLEIEVPSEMQNYSEAVFSGLDLRQTILSGIGLAVGGITYYILSRYWVGSLITVAVVLISSPFFVLAFWMPHGMTSWEYIKIIYRYMSSPKKLTFKNSNIYMNHFFVPDKNTGVFLNKDKKKLKKEKN